MSKSLIEEVIATYEDDTVTYFTKQGVEIGTLRGVEKIEIKKDEVKGNGGVARPISPKNFKDTKEQELVDKVERMKHDN